MAKIASQLAKVTFDLAGKARPNKPDAALLDAIQGAVTKALGPGYSISVYSGKENSGSQHGSNRHKTGLAADVHIIGPDGKTLNASKNKQQMLDVAKAFKELGGLGIGLGTDYMAGKGIHLDMFEPGVGQDTAWGNIGNAFQSWLDSFYRSPIQAALPSTMEANFPTREQGLLGTLTPEQMGIVPGALSPEQQANANAHIAYGNSRAANMQPPSLSPPNPGSLRGIPGPALQSTFPGRPGFIGSLPGNPIAIANALLSAMPGGTVTMAPSAKANNFTGAQSALSRALADVVSREANMRSNMPSALGPSRQSPMSPNSADRTKDDRVSITGAAPSAMGRPGAQMSPNSANRTKDDNARSLSPATPSALGSTIGRGGYSPPGSSFKAENVDRGLLGANPTARDVVGGANAPTWAGRPGVAGSLPAAPARTSMGGYTPPAPAKSALSPAVMGALAQRAGLEAIKDEDLSQVLAKTTVTHPPNPTVGLPPAAVTPPAAVIAPALVPRPPVQQYPIYQQPIPQTPAATAPRAPVAPALRPSDIYSGTIGSALDNTGKNTVSRDAFGNTTVTNQYGATTGMTPGGYQTAYGSLPGISGPSMGKIGGAVKGALPGIAGSTVGGLLGGPLGALLGAALAKAATQPGGILSGMQSFNTNAFGTINAAKAQGGGAFPDAPRGGYGSGGLMGASFSNRSSSGMSDISPAAAAAIGRGEGGLY